MAFKISDHGALLLSIGATDFKRVTEQLQDTEVYAITAINEDATLGLCKTQSGDDIISGTTLAQGAWLYGKFTEINVTSGTVMAYLWPE